MAKWQSFKDKGLDTDATDDQKRRIRQLQEMIDGARRGSYGDNPITMTKREATAYIDQLQARYDRKSGKHL